MGAVKTKTDFTTGKLFVKYLLFILPIVLTNLLQVTYNVADMMVVSLSPEKNAVGAIGTTSSFVHMVLNLCFGISVGADVVLARCIGAKDEDGAQKTVHTSVLVALVFGGISMAIGLIISRPVLSVMGNQGDLLDLATKYTTIYFAGLPFIALTNFLSAVFRAKGNAKLPLIVLSLSGLVNVGLNFFFVLVVGLSVEGVALGTVISNAVSAVVLFIFLCRQTDETKLHMKRLKIHAKTCGQILWIGFPAGLQSALFSLSNMIIQSSIVQVNNTTLKEMFGGSFSPEVYQPVVNGNSAAANLETFVYTAMNAVYQGTVSVTSQNVGAKKYKRLKQMIRCALLLTFIVFAVVGSLVFFLRKPLLSMYGIVGGESGSLEEIAMQTALTRMMFICVPYALCGWMENWSGMLRGMGKSVTSTVLSIFGAIIFRIVWIYTIFRAFPTLESIFISYPISWILTGVAGYCAVQYYIRKLKTKWESEGAEQKAVDTISQEKTKEE